MDIKDYGPKELELIQKIKDQDSTIGELKSLSFFLAFFLCFIVGFICSALKISVPYGAELIMFTILGSIIYSGYNLWTKVKIDNDFVKAMAERTGMKVVPEYTLICEGDPPQLYDENTKTFYRVRVWNDGVSIKEIKNI